jgi:hypothetical protein
MCVSISKPTTLFDLVLTLALSNMFHAIFMFNHKGEVLISRLYRQNIKFVSRIYCEESNSIHIDDLLQKYFGSKS